SFSGLASVAIFSLIRVRRPSRLCLVAGRPGRRDWIDPRYALIARACLRPSARASLWAWVIVIGFTSEDHSCSEPGFCHLSLPNPYRSSDSENSHPPGIPPGLRRRPLDSREQPTDSDRSPVMAARTTTELVAVNADVVGFSRLMADDPETTSDTVAD